MMTKKHFTALARALRANRASNVLINDIANICANDNPHFDYYRFKKAASPEQTGPPERVTALLRDGIQDATTSLGGTLTK